MWPAGRGLPRSVLKEKCLQCGYKHFTGVDGSDGMLREAAKSRLYKDLRLALLGTDLLPAEPDTYDIVIIVGALGVGFVPVSVVRELCKAATPGGYICMIKGDHRSEDHDEYKVALEMELQLMEEEKLWSRVSVKEFDKYMTDMYSEDVQEDKYVTGTGYLYRKNLE
ncbi:methyltransferase-like protein 27 [Thalassophryne amazonica]|uniref:methyltransferase-like protein 27 n=1 Tax=Thalassophryne amazonica TaxID=390379 RepID=UPI001471DD94|nr:methyltransferase-like protein 27 [Thalassophryne amazonica]